MVDQKWKGIHMQRGMNKKCICLLLCVCMCITGCERVGENIEGVRTIEKGISKVEQLEKQELVNPVSTIHVFVDHNGYGLQDEKKVFFSGIEEPSSFCLIDSKSKSVVYSDEVKSDGIAYGVFTPWEIPGDYYIEIERYGRSNIFTIQEGRKQQSLEEAIEYMTQMSVDDDKDSLIDMSLSIQVILQAIKCYPNVFEKDNTIISWMTKTVDEMLHLQKEDGSFSTDYEATAVCAGILWMCGEEFAKYDEALAQEFCRTAQKAKEWMEQHASKQNENEDFYYMCHYFRTHPSVPVYKAQIEAYLDKNISLVNENIYAFLGAVLYISSEKNTNRDLCTRIMQTFVSQTEDISEATKENNFFVEAVGIDTLMKHLLLICFIDYITPSREYMEIIENTMHYLSGANADNMNYLKELPEWKKFWTSIYILGLSDMNA